MRIIGLLLALLVVAQKSHALEFDAPLTLDGEGFATPITAFHEEPRGGLGFVTATGSATFRFVLSPNGRVQRSPLVLEPRHSRVNSYALGADLLVSTQTTVPIFTGVTNTAELRRYRPDGTLVFASQTDAGFGRTPALKEDADGGFWFANSGLYRANANGVIRRISRTVQLASSFTEGSFFTENALVEFSRQAIFRTTLSPTPVPHQTFGIPANQSLRCLYPNETGGMVGMALSFDQDTGSASVFRLDFNAQFAIVGTELVLSNITDLSDIRCSRTATALVSSRSFTSVIQSEVIMLDRNYALLWRAPLPASISRRFAAIGPNGEALFLDRASNSAQFVRAQRFSARGKLTTLANSNFQSSAAYDATGAVYLTRRLELLNGARLQVLQFSSGNFSANPTLIYDLYAPLGAPVPLAGAVENGQVRLLIKNPEVPYTQQLTISSNGAVQLEFERTDPIRQAQRFVGGWLVSTLDPVGNPSIELRADNGSRIFNTPIASNFLACETDICDFLGSAGLGKIDRFGAVSGLSALIGGDGLFSAPQQQASVRSQY